MTLAIQVSPELEQRLAAEAARRGQSVEEYAREVLEEQVAKAPGKPEASWLAGLPRADDAEVQALLLRQGAKSVMSLDELLRPKSDPDGDEELDVDAFLNARRGWQWQGAPGFPESAEQKPRSTAPKP